MLRSVFKCTVHVGQYVTIIGTSLATQWQPEALQRIDNVIERIVEDTYIYSKSS